MEKSIGKLNKAKPYLLLVTDGFSTTLFNSWPFDIDTNKGTRPEAAVSIFRWPYLLCGS